MLCALIMAGGKGTRFWPLSTEDKPKQFLKLLGDETMLQMTVNRIRSLIPAEQIFICTGDKYVSIIKEQLPELPERNIIIEPESRNTAPCIALSSIVIKRYYKDATMVVLPSDHLIKDEELFLNIISEASVLLEEDNSAIVTLGMKPDRPETGYGYIKCSSDKRHIYNTEAFKVERFVEKPTLPKALEYLKEGSYLWNGGMFLWKVDSILRLIKEHLPQTYNALECLESVEEKKLQIEINKSYSRTDSISIDYGIMEKVENIYVIPSNIGWDDIGNWNAVERYREKDEKGNIFMGKAKGVNALNNMVIAANNEVVVDGLSDIYVIENEGKIIIGKRENVHKIKELKEIV